MGKFDDLTGRRYNMLTVLEMDCKKNGSFYWKCLCDCGNMTSVKSGNLKSGMVKSCGCLMHQNEKAKTHGMSKSKIYRVWAAMKARCYNTKTAAYKDYGGRGIQMCDEWKDSSEKFMSWALANGYKESLTIERINNDSDYCPENCTWISLQEQSKNRRSCHRITYNNKTQNLVQWCEELNLPYKHIHNRISKLGWSFERAISEPCHTEKRNITKG